MNKKVLSGVLLSAVLIAAAVGWRVLNNNLHIAPNLEIVTATTVLAAIILGWRGAIVVPLISMVVSDLIIGNSSIYIYTWSSFALIGACALVLRKLNKKPGWQILSSAGFAIVSSFLFFVVTNFGVWAQGWYPGTLNGLIQSYTMAIPFYKTMLVGNLVLVPSVVIGYRAVRVYLNRNTSVVDTLVG